MFPQISFYAFKLTNTSTRLPDNRDSCTMTYWKDKAVLYGGIGRQIQKEVFSLNLRNFLWDRLEVKGELPLTGRYGHTANTYKNKLYILGGEKGYNKHLKMKELLNDLLEIDLETQQAKNIIYTGDIIENRSNHTAVIVNKYLIIIGGINSYSKMLSDVVSLNLDTMKS